MHHKQLLQLALCCEECKEVQVAKWDNKKKPETANARVEDFVLKQQDILEEVKERLKGVWLLVVKNFDR